MPEATGQQDFAGVSALPGVFEEPLGPAGCESGPDRDWVFDEGGLS
jgi:hypothetical protein